VKIVALGCKPLGHLFGNKKGKEQAEQLQCTPDEVESLVR
jgi:hypothetical protein